MLPALAEAMNGHARDPDPWAGADTSRRRRPAGGPRCASATAAAESGGCGGDSGGGLSLAG